MSPRIMAPRFHVIPACSRVIVATVLRYRRACSPRVTRTGQLQADDPACDREVSGDRQILVGAGGDRGGEERQRRVAGDVEEIGGAQMGIALGMSGIECGGLDRQLGSSALGLDLEPPVKALEASLDRDEAPHRLDRELEAAARRLGVPDPDRQTEFRWYVLALGAHGLSFSLADRSPVMVASLARRTAQPKPRSVTPRR
jgi:hypothetical protein